MAAFVYPPTQTLKDAGYYSWPGSGFGAEERHKEHAAVLERMGAELGVQIDLEPVAIDTEEDASRFIQKVQSTQPDGIVLILFKKGHWNRITQIVETAKLPVVAYAPLGVLLVDHIRPAREKQNLYLVNSEKFDAVSDGLRMIRAGAWMKQCRIMNIDGQEEKSVRVPVLGTEIHTVTHQRFYDTYRDTGDTDEVLKLARAYRGGAREILEPNDKDILEAARAYVALKTLLAADEADALMMNCLPGLQHPHKHVPPCMAFMTLRDEGIPAGCQSDLNATLSLVLGQYLFNRPGFQQNASMDTVQNLYFGAHCTCPSRMNGPGTRPEPYVLRSHAEAGWGCVPRVLLTEGQDVTLAYYMSSDAPELAVYTGTIVGCPEIPPTGGCRTNIQMTINEVEDVRDVKGMHQAIFYGNHARDLRSFAQLYGVKTLT
ncbi:MAG: hypothetical protein IT365_25940 [Candidatus Hydrogenedentes bacterium]|nr:hypothetical protein [Candidatus Hydrogenedentota bacterium]